METMPSMLVRLAMFPNVSRMSKMCHLFASFARPGAVRVTLGLSQASLLRQYSENSLSVRKKKMKNLWTAEEDLKLIELRKQGMGPAAIARELKTRTHPAVEKHIKVIECGALPSTTPKNQPWSPEEDALLLERRQQGVPLVQITKHLPGRCFNSVMHRFRTLLFRNNFPLNYKRGKYSEAECQRIIDMRLREAKSLTEVAIALNRSLHSVASAWHHHCAKLMPESEWEEMKDSVESKIRWTPEESKHLVELNRRGNISISDAALQFPSKTRKSVKRKIDRMLLRFPKVKT